MYARGIINRRYAYQGPHSLTLDIINACNINCVGCNYHSFRRNKDSFSPEWHQEKMRGEDFIRIIDEAEKMNIRHIALCGNGEPFMHPDILQFISYIKQKKIWCRVITNGTLIDKNTLHSLSSLRLDYLTLSLWDHDIERNEELRPGHKEKLQNIKKWLNYYREKRMVSPAINVNYMLSNRNYNFIHEMYKFAKENNIKRISFKLFRILEGLAEDYALSEQQIAIIIEQLKEISRTDRGKIVKDIHYFYRFLQGVHPERWLYLNDFLLYMPCYIGWIFMTISLNGDVAPCCGCPKYILGNIYQNKLSEIWNSKKYQEFRYRALTDKSSKEFDGCRCKELCAQHQLNLMVHKHFGRFVSPFVDRNQD